MSSPLRNRAWRYLIDAARAFEQAPIEGVVAVLLAAAFSYALETDGDAFLTWVEFAIRCVLVLAGAWTGTLLFAAGAWSARARWVATGVGVAAAVLHALFVSTFDLEAEAWRSVLLVAAAVLWVFAMPAFGVARADAVDRFRAVNGRFLLRTLGAVLYTAALFAGLALALAAINSLFELDLDEKIFGHVWAWLFFVLAPAIVIGGLPDFARPTAPRSDVARVVHRMTGFLVPPLLVLYYAILYAYAIRMMITREVPKNLVSPMVLAAGVLGALALFLFEPREEGSAGYRYLRFAPLLFLPLAGLGIWAITLRVDQYGWTEFRLIRLLTLAVLGGLALAATIQVVRRQRLALHFAPLALASAALLAAVGPWSVLNAARHSQRARLDEALEAAGLPPTIPAEITEKRTIPAEVYDQLSHSTEYLVRHFGIEALPQGLATVTLDRHEAYRIAERLGLQRAGAPGDPDRWVTGQLAPGAGVRVAGLTIHRLALGSRGDIAASGIVTAFADSTRLRIRSGGELLTVELATLLPIIDTGADGHPVDLTGDNARLDVTDAAGRHRGSLVIFHVNGNIDRGQLKIGHIDGLLLLEAMDVVR